MYLHPQQTGTGTLAYTSRGERAVRKGTHLGVVKSVIKTTVAATWLKGSIEGVRGPPDATHDVGV